jgi:phospholipid/cholesterol/gamma-HCH transport system substrate-binding protein
MGLPRSFEHARPARPAHRRSAALALLALVLAVTVLPSCGALGSAGPTYRVVAYFDEAVALYPHSKVKVMGMNVGTVREVKIDGSRVKVAFDVRKDVPLPTDVRITMQALTIIGERNVVLAPAWKPGKPKIQDHLDRTHDKSGLFVIPAGNTTTPVEPDDGLRQFRDLAAAIDPQQLASLATQGANAFSGNERTFNDLIHNTAGLSQLLASQDQQLVQAAKNLHNLVSAVNTRDTQLGQVIDGFSQASSALADQRQAISDLLSGADQLIDVGSSLLEGYKGTLPGDLATLSKLGEALQTNSGTFASLITGIPRIAQGLLDAYDPKTGQIKLGASLTASLQGAFRDPFCHTVAGLPTLLRNLVLPLLGGMCG